MRLFGTGPPRDFDGWSKSDDRTPQDYAVADIPIGIPLDRVTVSQLKLLNSLNLQ